MEPQFSSTQFINEPIEPIGVAAGPNNAPLAPTGFKWRGKDYTIDQVLETKRGANHDRTHGSGEIYTHRHWFTAKLSDGQIVHLYFERQSRGGKHRWWLHTIDRS